MVSTKRTTTSLGLPPWVVESWGLPGSPFCGEDDFVQVSSFVVARTETRNHRLPGPYRLPGHPFCADEG